MTKWQPIVKQNREKPTLTFVDQERAKMPRKKSIAALNADSSSENDFEREIMAKLRETNATTGATWSARRTSRSTNSPRRK